MILSLEDLKKLWGAPNYCFADTNIPLGPVCIDSRSLKPGDFFVPLLGERFDGHNFLSEAAARGAQGAVISAHMSHLAPNNFCHWSVDNSLIAYQELAHLHRQQLRCPVIAVTGSVGKTTTRELIKAAIASLGAVISSSGNNNNDIGVPMTLLRGNPKHAALIVEMGMRNSGEIMRLSRCVCPNVAVITNIGTAHIGRLGSKSAIARAKCEITAALQPCGLLVIPSGDILLETALKRVWHGRVFRVTLEDEVDDSIISLPPANLIGHLSEDRQQVRVGERWHALPLEGRHNARNFLLALAVARELQAPIPDMRDLHIVLPTGCSHRLQLGSIKVLDESYNASPESVVATLDLLKYCNGRHFAVLGAMLELGKHSIALHQYVAKQAVSMRLDGLVIVAGKAEAEAMTMFTSLSKRVVWVKQPEAAIFPLTNWLAPGDTLLLKASHNVGLNRLIPLLEKQFMKPGLPKSCISS